MTRRKHNNSAFEDLFGIAAALPWWIGVGLAAASYLVLHRYAIAQLPTSPVPGQVGEMVVGQMVKSFSIYLQYVLPILFLAAAAASYFKGKQRERLVAGVANHGAAAVQGMTWREFELLVGEGFRLRGYTVTETGGGADGGVDLTLKKGAEVFLVQCKQWKALKVSVTTVRELYGVMAARGAAGGFVVTSGTFTRDAHAFADGRNIELIDGPALETMINQSVRTQTLRAEPTLTQEPISTPSSAQSDPLCPRCGGPMLRRIAKQGANVGKEFWGCKSFPACRGVKGL